MNASPPSSASCPMPPPTARHWILGGRVQAVGFRPFVYRLALRHRLSGWVINQAGQVEILAQGANAALDAFGTELISAAPPLARPEILVAEGVEPEAFRGFAIVDSAPGVGEGIHVPPDYFACDECLRELHDRGNRRYRYPFINCTQCGPRYTLIRRLPYDRPNTTMAGFALCDDCLREYQDPGDRRFHAEPLACPVCGPALEFTVPGGAAVGVTASALSACIAALNAGRILAIKGIGGYHLVCDARDAAAIARLRMRKPRPHKPLAVMFPMRGADGLAAVREAVAVDDVAAHLLLDPMRPIVLCEKRPDGTLCPDIAPGLKDIGVMLPYSPLHHILLEEFSAPVVATSANRSG